MPRMVTNITEVSKEQTLIYTAAENEKRKRIYKKIIGHCCMPDCSFGFNLHVHHIWLVSQGGTDDFTNYIILCGKCHKTRRVHRFSEERKIQLSVYKFYVEKMELGFCSDEMSNEEFRLRLLKIERERKQGNAC